MIKKNNVTIGELDIGHHARRLLLCPLNILYSIGWYYFDRSFGPRKINQPVLPVISIGNLTLGGTGKTGVVISLARYLQEMGLKIAIVIRGWASRQEQLESPSFVSDQTSVAEVGDEAKLLKRCLPQATIVACRNRNRAIHEIADKTDSQVVILDDGFQYRAIKKNLEVVLVDCLNPDGAGRLFPPGFLRQPLSTISRADIILLTHSTVANKRMREYTFNIVGRYAPEKPYYLADYVPVAVVDHQTKSIEDIKRWRGRSVIAVCGIGNPESFEQTLETAGLKIERSRRFPDHHKWRSSDLERLPDLPIFITQKDAERFPAEIPAKILKVEMKIEENFYSDHYLARVCERAGLHQS